MKCNLGPVWIPLDFRISKKLGLLRFLDSIIYGKIRNVWIHSWTLESRVFQTGPRSDQTIKAVAAFPPPVIVCMMAFLGETILPG